MRLLLTTLAVVTLGTAVVADEPNFVLNRDTIISVRAENTEVKIVAFLRGPAADCSLDHNPSVAIAPPFLLPPHMHIRWIEWGRDRVTVCFGFEDATAATEFASRIQAK